MTALSLLNRHLNRNLTSAFEQNFARPFISPVWFKEDFHLDEKYFGFSSQMKFDETSSNWVLTLEAAGVTKDNLKVDVKEGHLVVTGEKTKGLELGKFERFFKIPDGVDLEKIEASFEDGILNVQLPLEEKKQAKTILIK